MLAEAARELRLSMKYSSTKLGAAKEWWIVEDVIFTQSSGNGIIEMM
jgi:hypothetical protein